MGAQGGLADLDAGGEEGPNRGSRGSRCWR
jgi:hypothetical protein